MADEVKVISRTGYTLEADVFQPDGTEREFGVSLTEVAQGRLYLGDCSTIQPGDIIVAYDTVSGNIIGGGEYKAGVSNAGAAAGITGAGYVGDYKEDGKVYFIWNTNIAPSTDGTIKVYKNDGTGEVTSPTGITDDRDFDGKTGVHLCSIDLRRSLNTFYAKERDYLVVLSDAVVDGVTVNTVIASFSIENRYQGIDFKRDV